MTNRLPREIERPVNESTDEGALSLLPAILQHCLPNTATLLPARLREEFVDIWYAYDAADERDDDPDTRIWHKSTGFS